MTFILSTVNMASNVPNDLCFVTIGAAPKRPNIGDQFSPFVDDDFVQFLVGPNDLPRLSPSSLDLLTFDDSQNQNTSSLWTTEEYPQIQPGPSTSTGLLSNYSKVTIVDHNYHAFPTSSILNDPPEYVPSLPTKASEEMFSKCHSSTSDFPPEQPVLSPESFPTPSTCGRSADGQAEVIHDKLLDALFVPRSNNDDDDDDDDDDDATYRKQGKKILYLKNCQILMQLFFSRKSLSFDARGTRDDTKAAQ